jgi:hypothetical protein
VIAEVSGRAFLGPLKHITRLRGQGALDRVLRDAGPQAEQVFGSRIRQSGWYPYDAYVGLLRTADRYLGSGDTLFCRELGALAGQADLGTIFRVYAALASPERLIRACKRVWPSYHRNAGSMEAIAWEPNDTRLRITDFPDMAPEHCRLMEGWMIAVMEQIGIRIPRFAETVCTSTGGPYHEFHCTWTTP